MKTIKMIIISILLVLSGATSAHAMGDREQGALLGAGAVILLGNLIGMGQQQTTTRYVETPVYYEQRPRVVYREPYYERERVIIIDNSPRHRPRPRHHDYYDRRGYYR